MRLYRFGCGARNVVGPGPPHRFGCTKELNDDFEFIGVALAVKEERIALREMRWHPSVENGVIWMRMPEN